MRPKSATSEPEDWLLSTEVGIADADLLARGECRADYAIRLNSVG